MSLANGKILLFSDHAHQRLPECQRDYPITARAVLRGVQLPTGKRHMRFEYGNATVVIEKVSHLQYRAITVWAKSKRIA
ncbi:MAG: hypothetical protein ACUVS2_03150 [Candidatus Flexifilum sp.]|jgi:hypothetical protein|nr:MAG: hypothetical protein CUN53_02830 [Phototrophicales bacterium]